MQDSLDEAKAHLKKNADEKAKESLSEGTLLFTNRQKSILLKTVEEYLQHELAENEDDRKKMRLAEERVEKAMKSHSTRKTAKWVSPVFCPSSARFTPPSHRASPEFRSWLGQRDREYFFSYSAADRPSKLGNCVACGKFSDWWSRCNQVGRSGSSRGNLGGRWRIHSLMSKVNVTILL